ncbi:MAG: short-chain dehydrogenase/reductase [Herbinix sp.]|nr:short-chain dehydrogenase/reductase [Herbinix sp.]
MSKNIAIVTGATGGIGQEFVKKILHEEIYEIWVIARNIDKLNQLKEAYGEKIVLVPGDLSQDSTLVQIEEMLQNSKPMIRYLINNAGGGRMGRYDEFSKAEMEAHIATHCTAMTILCSLCIPYMQEGSHIINMSSQSAFQPVPYINLYAASKAFVRSYSRALNVELRGTGIVCTVACPGWVKTELLEQDRNGKQIRFPAIALPEYVVRKIMRDAKKGKDSYVYGAYVKYQHLLTKIFPHKLVMKTWLKQIKDYI